MERIAFEYRKDEPFRVVKDGCVGTIRCMEGGGVSKYIMEVKELGFMDNETQQIKVLTEVEALNTMSDGTCRTIKSQYGNTSSANFMYSSTYGATGDVALEKSIVAMRGRNPENPSDRTVGAPTEQRLEPNSQGICNTLTSVTKDNLVMERKCISTKGKENDVASTILSGYERPNMTGFNADNGVLESVNTQYRIRKLTPRECYRLMAVPEKDIDKMLEVNSNTQCYKQAGNSIVVNCLIAIFSQMRIQGIPRWNEGLSEKYK